MRGSDVMQEPLFTSFTLESFVPKNHPLRPIRELFNEALRRVSGLFDEIYSDRGRESIPPERLLRAQLLQMLYSIRSERQLVEQLQYNLLFRWFVGLSMDDAAWNHSVFSKYRDRLLEHEVIPELFAEVLRLARKKNLLSDDHFSVDGTLIQAWASHKSFRPKDAPGGAIGRNQEADFHGEARKNSTHESVTDPDARLYTKSKGEASKLYYGSHIMMENRSGLVVDVRTTPAGNAVEREAAIDMLASLPGEKRRTIGADKNYDYAEFVDACRGLKVSPHVAQRMHSAIDERTTRHVGYALSLRARKQIEERFGWIKTIAPLRQVKVRGNPKVHLLMQFGYMACNLVRLKNLLYAGR